MKKIILTALSASLLALSVSANANQFLYTSIGDDGAGGDARLQGSFIYDTALSEYSTFDLTLEVDSGVVFSNFVFGADSNFFPQNTTFVSNDATNTVGATAFFRLYDTIVRGNNAPQTPVSLNWDVGYIYAPLGGGPNVDSGIPLFGSGNLPPSTSFAVTAVTAVPEPTTYAMMGIGLFALYGFRRRSV